MLADCIEKVKVPTKIPRSSFLEEGNHPIISQEADFINGYWNDEADLVKVPEPVVVFGDHTQVLKLVDFDFVVGADGVKILKPKHFLDAGFLRFYLETNPFPSLGYARHYRHISTLGVPLPPLEEQKRIVAVLDQAFAAVDRARAHVEQSRRNASEVFDSVLASVDGEQRLLGSLVTLRTGKLDANAAVENGQYPFFTCAKDVYAIDRFAFDCEAILLAGNNAVGDFNVKHYRGKFNAYQRTYVITINDTNQLLYRYLYFQLVRSLKHFKEASVGAGTKFLKLGMINGLKISVPKETLNKSPAFCYN